MDIDFDACLSAAIETDARAADDRATATKLAAKAARAATRPAKPAPSPKPPAKPALVKSEVIYEVQRPEPLEAAAPREPTKPTTLTITSHGVYVLYSAVERHLKPEGIRRLCATLTHHQIIKIGNKQMGEKIFRYYRIQELDGRKYFVVARFGAFIPTMLAAAPTFAFSTRCTIAPGDPLPPRPADAPPGIELNANQQVVAAWLAANNLSAASQAAGTGSAILVMATGTGKSYMGVHTAVAAGRKTLIVLPNSNNLSEWRAIISVRYPWLKLGQYDGRRKVDGDIVITMIGSLNKPTWKFAGKASPTLRSIDYLHRFGTIIFDEIHNYASTARLEAFWNAGARLQLGLTATPDERADGMDHAYQQHVGPLIRATEIPGYNPTQTRFEGHAFIIKYTGTPSHTTPILSALGYFDAGATNQMVSEDPARRELVRNIVEHARRRNRNVFIFAERLEQIAQLQAALPFPTTKLVGGQDESVNADAKTSQVILMTYSYGSESISIPRMDCIIFYTSRRNKMNQKLGRIERGGGDESIIREVYDIVDASTNLKKQLADRKREYVEKQYTITVQKVDHANTAYPIAAEPVDPPKSRR